MSTIAAKPALQAFVDECAVLCRPDRLQWCDGSAEEQRALHAQLVTAGTLIPLDPELRPDSFLARSDPGDVARVEQRTFVCSERQDDAGPTNNWRAPRDMKAELRRLFDGSMVGRTMYVVPFCMGPLDSPLSRLGVELTDSAYVAASMAIMTRMGSRVLERLRAGEPFVPCLHSVGRPLSPGERDVPWPCNPEQVTVAHFPEERAIWSFGSGYGGNALLGKKCFALRIASVMGRDQGWLAEHMLLMGVKAPNGEKSYVAAAFPSACGKTNFAMMLPPVGLEGYEVSTIGDDIAWLEPRSDGRLHAVNPEAGMFGVAPGTSPHTNPNACRAIAASTLFTNTALTAERDVWWEGLGETVPAGLVDWRGQPVRADSAAPAAHPNSRFTTPLTRLPSLDPKWDSGEGVPISAIIFGGRLSRGAPLVSQAYDWAHGVYLGATLASEPTAAAEPQAGLRRDPMAMLPFCGYDMSDYFAHWLGVGQKLENPPAIFRVNWFQRDGAGRFMWPGFGQNLRVLDWIVRRAQGRGNARTSPLGWMPRYEDLNWTGLDFSERKFAELQAIDREALLEEAEAQRRFFERFSKLPKALSEQRELFYARLTARSPGRRVPRRRPAARRRGLR